MVLTVYQVSKLSTDILKIGSAHLEIISSLLVVLMAVLKGDYILTKIRIPNANFVCLKASFLCVSFIASGSLLCIGLAGLGLEHCAAYSCAYGFVVGLAYTIMIWPMVFDYLHPTTGMVANHLTRKERAGQLQAEQYLKFQPTYRQRVLGSEQRMRNCWKFWSKRRPESMMVRSDRGQSSKNKIE
jgi:hypothetical protein